MSTAFIILAGLGVLAALAFVLPPLLFGDSERARLRRRLAALDDLADELEPEDLERRREKLKASLAKMPGQGGSGYLLLVGLLIVVPASTILLYQVVGEPQGLREDDSQVGVIRSALIDLAREIERDPDQVDPWVRLGLSYKDLQEYSSAEHALRRALYIDNQNAFIQVELAETLLFASGGGVLPEESAALLESALANQPDNQKALWLLGIQAFQRGDYDSALTRWQALVDILPQGSVRQSVVEQIDRAERARSGQPARETPALPADHPPIETAAASGPVFPVQIAITPELSASLEGSETVFLVVRAANGPAAPLAVRRLQVSDLPTELALSDADAMIDGLMLSAYPEIIVTARVSMSGQPEPSAGDLQGQLGPLSILESPRASIVIDQTL